MTKFQAEIDVMPKKEILDPQGKAVTGSMKNLGLSEIQNVRIGKHVSLEIEAENETVAREKVEQACKKPAGQLNYGKLHVYGYCGLSLLEVKAVGDIALRACWANTSLLNACIIGTACNVSS